jgi:hypothetical protein
MTRKRRITYLPTSALLSGGVTVYTWLLTTVFSLANITTHGRWPSNFRLGVCQAVTIAVTLYLVIWGNRAMRMNPIPAGSRIGVTGMQAVWVVVVALVVGVFGAWMILGFPPVPPLNGW